MKKIMLRVILVIIMIIMTTGCKKTVESNEPMEAINEEVISESMTEGLPFESVMIELDENTIDYDVDPSEFDEVALDDINDSDEVTLVDVKKSIDGFSPNMGIVGTKVVIEGRNLCDGNLQALMLGDIQVPIYNYSDTHIYGSIPSGLESNQDYELSIIYENETYALGTFTYYDLPTTFIMEETITDVTQQHYFTSETMNVFIPKDVLIQASKLSVEKIEGSIEGSLEEKMMQGEYYKIEIGNQHEFDEPISFAVPLPEGYLDSGNTPRVVSLNETTGEWKTVFSEITDNGMLAVRTDHLSFFGLFYEFKQYVTPEGNFIISYWEGDERDIPGRIGYDHIQTSEALAVEIGRALESAKANYDRKLGSAYALKVPYTNYHVILSSAFAIGDYDVSSGTIKLPTNYRKPLDLEQTVAHELFHLYQNQQVNGKIMHSNRFITEAIAEYASYRLALDETPQIYNGIDSSERPGTINQIQEYSYAAYLDYMFDKQNKTFLEFYEEYVQLDSWSWEAWVNKFFDDESDLLPSEFYTEFWREAFTEKGDVRSDNFLGLMAKSIRLTDTALNEQISLKAISEYSQKFYSLQLYRVRDEMPIRYIRAQTISDQYDLWATHISNDRPFALNQGPNSISFQTLLENEKTIDHAEWVGVPAYGEIDNYVIFEADINDLLLFAVQMGEDARVHLSSIDGVAQTKTIEDIELGEKFNVVYGFNGLFPDIERFLVETDFGDGKVISKEFSQQKTINIKAEHMYNKYATEIKGSLYDITAGKKELIAQIVIPVYVDGDIRITVSNPEPALYDTVTFDVTIGKEGYKYIWDLDDQEHTSYERDVSKVEHVYDDINELGLHDVSIVIKDDSGLEFVQVSTQIQVVEPRYEFPQVLTRMYPSGQLHIRQSFDLIDSDTVAYRIEGFEDNENNTPDYAGNYTVTRMAALICLAGPDQVPLDTVANGEHVSYYKESKVIKRESYLVDGLTQGLVKEYYEDGTIKNEIDYVDGKIHGIYSHYLADGTLYNQRIYENGDFIKYIE